MFSRDLTSSQEKRIFSVVDQRFKKIINFYRTRDVVESFKLKYGIRIKNLHGLADRPKTGSIFRNFRNVIFVSTSETTIRRI